MLVFLLKSTTCLAIFWVFYKVVLERESIHHFKRFFLLGALIASFLIPNIVFVEYVEIAQNSVAQDFPITDEFLEVGTDHLVAEEHGFDWEVLLWSVYILGVIAFGFRFMRHLTQIWSRIRRNPKFKENFVTKVLLRQSLPPHTFFNYIFLNQQQFEEKNIPQEVLVHEETHAKQRHSLDILFIELAQVIFWFNPIIYLFKSSIKLNHEFLADRAVIDKNNDHLHYQNTILSYLSHDSFNTHQSTGIANALNYSSIKKRFTVMKTNTSKKSFLFRSLLLLPLTALLLFGFSEHREIAREIPTYHIITMELLGIETVQIQDEVIHINEVAQVLNQEYLSTYNSKKTKVEINAVQPVYLNTINDLSKEIRTTGIDLIEIFANEVIMEEGQFKENVPITPSTTLLNAKQMTVAGMDEGQKEFAGSSPASISQNADQKTINPINIKINKSGQILFQKDLVPLSDLKETLLKINNHLSFDERKKTLRSVIQVDQNTSKNIIAQVDKILAEYGSATITIVGPKVLHQESATREEMKKYNALAKKYNEMDRNHMFIKKKEVMHLKTIYGKMSKKQRADAEPFPNFPPPPPAPPAPGATKPPMPPSAITNVKEIKPVAPPSPPAPPKPPKPIEHIKKMAAKGATFTLNGKEISSEKALEVVQKKQYVAMLTMGANESNPVVELSTGTQNHR
ncbi:M56 family metallopeptidase [Flagellimonas halotolerans]|uniref:M56 family metallopeptidase n=1 Tax=Flagellimonas halotolerans TaxID=3112164 RepID=A0ABU6IMF0_9FLAO|nr:MULTISPECIES: M56 family metallopeptidase [unclassified Allomuricauda]MEC3964328.1 M56 family metallopeptidase [Muricauda sp. SYSU M86414]MEC4264198.1 M56 family metallopeptidase [Muricauda sp. SYSU M84420]